MNFPSFLDFSILSRKMNDIKFFIALKFLKTNNRTNSVPRLISWTTYPILCTIKFIKNTTTIIDFYASIGILVTIFTSLFGKIMTSIFDEYYKETPSINLTF